MRFTVRGNATTVPHGETAAGAQGRMGRGEREQVMVRILVDGEGSRAVELCIRAALGDRADEEQWLISAVKLPARWVVSFLASPDERLVGYTWCGPAHQVRAALEEALRHARLGELTKAQSRQAAVACDQVA
jgi:hypothetical protein